jgi:acyl-CoA dehydrogenase
VLQSAGAVAALKREIGILLREAREPDLVKISAQVERTVEQAEAWLSRVRDGELEAGARRLALTLGRAMELALLTRHAQWSLDQERDPRTRAAARRLAAHGINLLADMDGADSRRLARDEGD